MNLISIKAHVRSDIFKNIIWLFGDKIIRLGVGLVLGVLIARHLGPGQFGKWNYAIALTVLLAAFSTLGLESIIVRDLVNSPEKRDEILGTTLVMRILGGLFSVFLSLLIVFVSDFDDKDLLIIVFFISFGFIFQSLDVIDGFFQSKVESKYAVIAKNVAFIFCAILRGIALWVKADLTVFVILGLFEVFLGACGLIYFYCRYTDSSIKFWRIDLPYFKSTIKECLPLIFAGFVIMIYMRIDQIMLKQLINEKAVGVYSAAVRLSEVWYFVYMVFSSSVFPAMIKIKEQKILYQLRTQRVFDIMVIVAFSIALFFTFSSDWIINALYGEEFIEAAQALKINIWCGVFVALGIASSQYLVIEGLTRISFYRSGAGAIVNLILNFIFIPIFGIVGAAISTLIAQIFAAYLFDYFSVKTRPLFYMKTKSLLLITIWKKLPL